MVNTFVPFEIDELDKTTILEEKVFKHVLQVTDPIQRTRLLVELQEKAKELKVLKSFNQMFKAYQSDQNAKFKQRGSNTINFTNPPINDLKCGKWQALDTGIKRTQLSNFEAQTIEACSHPILPVERLINVENGLEKVKLAFYKDSKWQDIVVEKNTIASKNKILQLANRGIEVNENNAKELITYLSDVVTLNINEIPVNKGIGRLGWIKDTFSPYTKELKYDGDLTFKSVFECIKQKGDFKEWKKELIELRKNKVAHLVIASSFASPLIEIVGGLPFIVHLWGGTGSGKTVALMVAMSIWGNPEIGKLVKTLNSTQVALARYASFLHNVPFAGDELQTIKNKWESFDKLVMYLCEGMDKSRGTAIGGIEEQKEWKCCFLFTGEEPITKASSGGGVKNRVIEIEATETIIEDGNHVSNFVRENYGHAGKMYIENLTDKEAIKNRHREIMQDIVKKFDTTGKQANTMATILLADEISTELFFKDEKLSYEDIEIYLKSQKEVDQSERAYELILDWININQNRFNENSQNEIWGEIKEDNCFIIPSKLYEFLDSQGISFDAIKKRLADSGKMLRNSSGEYTINRRLFKSSQKRVISIKLPTEINNTEEIF